MNTLSDLFPKTRAEILRLLFAGGNQEIHLRDLARLAGLSPAALQKELTSLAAKEFVLTRRDGNRLYYRANIAHPRHPAHHPWQHPQGRCRLSGNLPRQTQHR